MHINSILIPDYACTAFEVTELLRRGCVVACESADFSIQRVLIAFKREEDAVAFEKSVCDGSADIIIEEDHSINAAPTQMRDAYNQAVANGNTAEIERILAELFDDYDIEIDSAPPEPSSVRFIAIMHDDGVAAYGFDDRRQDIVNWMLKHGFKMEDYPVRQWMDDDRSATLDD